MLREEAIKYLKEMKDECNDTIHKVRYVTQEEALDMAIKALEQEPSGDLISRQAVLDIMMEKESHKWGKDYGDWVDAIEEIKKLPSVNPYPQSEVIMANGTYYNARELSSVNPQEPKTGHWKRRIVDSGYNADWKCSECGYKVYTDFVNYNFCPNCGAKMEKGGEE